LRNGNGGISRNVLLIRRLKKRVCDTPRLLLEWLKRILQGDNRQIKSTIHHDQQHFDVADNTRGSTITVSTRNGFPTAPKRLRAADDYLFSATQTAGDSDYINAVLPHVEDEDDNSPNGYFFLWTHETE
jgi:hypothetical protein